MTKKWGQMTKNQKLETLRAEVAKIMNAVHKLMRRLDDVERSKKTRRPKVKKASMKTMLPVPEPFDQQASEGDIGSSRS